MHYKRLICMGVSLLITIGVQGISIAADSYDPYKTASYASKYAVNHNSNYKYFSGSDCTNFISQSAKAGGQAMDMNKWYPFITTPEIFRKNDMWYYIGGDILYKTTTAWTTVAGFEYYVKNDGRSDWKILATLTISPILTFLANSSADISFFTIFQSLLPSFFT